VPVRAFSRRLLQATPMVVVVVVVV